MEIPLLDMTIRDLGLGSDLSIFKSVAMFQEEDINRIQKYEALPLQEVEYDK